MFHIKTSDDLQSAKDDDNNAIFHIKHTSIMGLHSWHAVKVIMLYVKAKAQLHGSTDLIHLKVR